MNRTLIAALISTILIAPAASAIEVYKDDVNAVKLAALSMRA